MPRRDEFYTNQQMLIDFNAESHEVLVSAYENQLGDRIPDALNGKPLNAISLYVTKRLVHADIEEDVIRNQELNVRPLCKQDTEDMKVHLSLRERPQDVQNHYANIAARIADISIDHNLGLRALIPVEGIIANYTARLTDSPYGPTRHVGTLKEKPTKVSLALGKTFADEASTYVRSRAFVLASIVPSVAYLLSDTTHRFGLEMRTDIPLNGYESKEWLNAYANKMFAKETTSGTNLERMKALRVPDAIVDSLQIRYDEIVAALRRVEEILEKK